MTDIQVKALALLNEVRRQYPNAPDSTASRIAICRALEQHEAPTKEIERLNGVIIATADHWLALQTEHPIAWEGAIDEAMAAACAKIRELTEQHEAFKQKVSDAVQDYHQAGRPEIYFGFDHFIIPKPKPDELVEVLKELVLTTRMTSGDLRAALEVRGLEIREKGQ